MLDKPVSFQLPKPWEPQNFVIDRLGPMSFFVGPNGSGKSRFARSLQAILPMARLLGTDRLEGMSMTSMSNLIGDSFASGYQKNQFSYFRQAGSLGSGIDVFMILEERPDIRILIEATLSSLFDREITLDWDSGYLVPNARLSRTGETYRLDREECHGIRELLVLLTHLYDDRKEFLIIDEPELNLHPQFQSFFIQEARKVAGKHIAGTSTKGIILITHSPFILDLRSIDDMQSVFCFFADHSLPKSIGALTHSERSRFVSMIPRLNVHHKQLFFADNPIFVEGVSDAQIIEAIQERRKASITAAGSCLIDVGGCEELTKYVDFCQKLGKKSYFLFDLDSLFTGSLRQCVREDGVIIQFLAGLGLGSDFASYCGALDQELTKAVRIVESNDGASEIAAQLRSFFDSITDGPKKLAQQRVAILIEIASSRDEMRTLIGDVIIDNIEGRLNQVKAALKTKNIFLIKGGAIEHHLPEYKGNRYLMNENTKRKAVADETALLSSGSIDSSLSQRYGELFSIIQELPAKPPVDTESILRKYVGDYIHELQGLVISKPDWDVARISAHFASAPNGLGKLVQITDFTSTKDGEFKATLRIGGSHRRSVEVSHETNAGMRRFAFRLDDLGSGNSHTVEPARDSQSG